MWGIIKKVLTYMIIGFGLAMMLFFFLMGIMHAWTWGY